MIEICNLTRASINTRALKNIAKVLLNKENKAHLDLSVALVGEKRMRELNRIYRRRDYPANVLSFEGGEYGLGEVALCPSVISKEAKKYGMIRQTALAYMLIHGILHLVGYEHDKNPKRMESKERYYLSLLQ